jgi:hypothetical protein
MSRPAILDDPHSSSAEADTGDLADRLHRVEGEVAELRHTMSELAEIVVGDIKERREAAAAMSAPMPEVSIPSTLAPGGQTVLNTVNAARRPWLLIDLVREFGVMVRMYMDPRYRVRRATQLMVPLILGLFVASYVFFNNLFVVVPVLTPILEHAVAIVLAVLLYKVLSREVARYRQMLANLTVGPRAAAALPVSLWNTDPDTAAVTRQESP